MGSGFWLAVPGITDAKNRADQGYPNLCTSTRSIELATDAAALFVHPVA